jgi:hypothetical protein
MIIRHVLLLLAIGAVQVVTRVGRFFTFMKDIRFQFHTEMQLGIWFLVWFFKTRNSDSNFGFENQTWFQSSFREQISVLVPQGNRAGNLVLSLVLKQEIKFQLWI